MITATNKNYVIKGLGQTKETGGGIIIQQSDECELAKIMSVGPDIEKNAIAVGSSVVVNWNAVIQVKVAGETVFVIHADNVLAVIEE